MERLFSVPVVKPSVSRGSGCPITVHNITQPHPERTPGIKPCPSDQRTPLRNQVNNQHTFRLLYQMNHLYFALLRGLGECFRALLADTQIHRRHTFVVVSSVLVESPRACSVRYGGRDPKSTI